jgi:peptide/nickel transport system permease protein
VAYSDYLKRRIVFSIITLIGLSLLIFSLSRLLPGDPARVALGEVATEEQIEALRKELWLDKPLPIQYLKFVYDLLHLRLGLSTLTWRDAWDDIISAFPATLELVIVAMIMASIIGPLLGVISASKTNKFTVTFIKVFGAIGVAVPRFFLCILLQLIFVYWLGFFPMGGRISSGITVPQITGLYLLDSIISLRFDTFIDALHHIVLPAISLALSPIAQLAALTYEKMVNELNKDYVLTLKANKMPKNIILYKYTLKNAFSASLTTIGLFFGVFFEAAFSTEIVFQWPGLARYGARAATRSDFNAVVGCALIIGVMYSISNFIVDLLYGYINPRVAKSYGAAKAL